MTTSHSNQGSEEQSEDTQAKGKAKTNAGGGQDWGDVGRAVRESAVKGAVAMSAGAAGIVGLSILESIKLIRRNRNSVVMVRVSKEDLQRMDDLVECGLTNSRSEAAAFLIAEGIKARAELYDKIAEQSQVIRSAREQLRSLLDEESSQAPSETQDR